MKRRPTVSVVIPVYNSSQTLEPLMDRLHEVLPTCTSAYEVVLVNDGSRDASWEVVSALARKYPKCRGFNLMRNYGQHNALLAGIRQACNDVVVTIDDDLQNPPEEIPRLLEALSVGADVVYGAPQHPAFGLARRLSSRITKLVLQQAMGAESAGHVSAFRAFRCSLRHGFAEVRGPTVNIDVLLSWSTTRFNTVYVRHDPRTVGRSNYTLRQLVRHALNMLTGFSTLPLRFASMIGFLFTLIGIGILIEVLVRHFTSGVAVPGFAFLASIISVFAGAQLFTIGIIGEYLARAYQRTMDRPTYVITRSTTDEESGTPGVSERFQAGMP